MNAQERLWKVGSLVGIMLVVFLVVLSVNGIKDVGTDDPIYNSITVNGTAEAFAIPDVATFSFGVTEKAKTVAEAQTAASDKINSALSAVRGSGIEDKDIKTTAYSISPSYEYVGANCNEFRCTPGTRTLTGYEVSQSVQVKIRDLDKVGSVFSSIGALDVENVSGLTFSIDDIEKIKAQAQAQAIADAKAKAKVLASQLGVRLVKITSFYDNSDSPIFYGRAEGMGGDAMSVKSLAAPAPEVPAGEQKVTSNVMISYEIR